MVGLFLLEGVLSFILWGAVLFVFLVVGIPVVVRLVARGYYDEKRRYLAHLMSSPAEVKPGDHSDNRGHSSPPRRGRLQ